MNLAELRTDDQLTEKGVWIKFGDDAEFLIASASSNAYAKATARHSRGVPPTKLRNDVTTAERVTVEAMADAILLGWRGNVEDDGQKLAVSRENKLKLLNVRQFREWVAVQSSDIANFQAEALAADAADLKSAG